MLAHPLQPLEAIPASQNPTDGSGAPSCVVPSLARTQVRPRSSGVPCWRVDDLDAVAERDTLDNLARVVFVPQQRSRLKTKICRSAHGSKGLRGIDVACSAMKSRKKSKISRLCRQVVALAVRPTLDVGRRHDQLEHHEPGGVLRQRPPGAHDAVSDGGKHALDRVGCAQVIPVLGQEVVERQQRVAVLGQASRSHQIIEVFVHGCASPCPASGFPR